MFGMKEILPRFQDRGRGHLVNIASSAGKGGFPGGATYCGTKHFVVGVSEAVRGELRGTDIEVSCVMPGIVNTELAQGLPQARGVKNINPRTSPTRSSRRSSTRASTSTCRSRSGRSAGS